MSEQAQVLRTSLSEITTTIGRKTSGVTIFRLADGDAVSSIACVSDLDSGNGNGKPAAAAPNGKPGNGSAAPPDAAKSAKPNGKASGGAAVIDAAKPVQRKTAKATKPKADKPKKNGGKNKPKGKADAGNGAAPPQADISIEDTMAPPTQNGQPRLMGLNGDAPPSDGE